ncbi:DUF6544 family protein [Leptospira limi]|uniref:Uncharacterized protein n=1 Tax=Leptospira limi TaxID=2950023 RepID=A0ABT3M0M5_9LEPT|nr:DUF6544 family protein [Leptospira limi]MCW7463525.1 hypothetical protein [Leptospira limi]
MEKKYSSQIYIWMERFFFGSLLLCLNCCHPLQDQFQKDVNHEFAEQNMEIKVLTELDLITLPKPVQRYLRYTKALGKPVAINFRLVFDELMFKTQQSDPMVATSEQYNFFARPSRHFYMRASMKGIPFRVYHSYTKEKATMNVKILSLFGVVDAKGEELTKAETVTFLNDLCLFAPSALIYKNISWEEIDLKSTRIWFQNGNFRVSAVLYFNELGELTNFISEDRYALQDDGSFRNIRWSTPVKEYKEFNGVKLPTYGEAIWHYPEGDFVYGKFFLKGIATNLKSSPFQ